MTDNAGKYIAGTAMLLLAVAIYFVGTSLVNVAPTCTGWGWINPVCWLGSVGNLVFDTIFIVLAVWTSLFGIVVFLLPSEKAIWGVLLYVFLTLTIANVFIPDPIPFVDEMVLGIISLIAGGKAFGESKGKNLLTF